MVERIFKKDFQSTEIRDSVRDYLEEEGYLCISLYDSTLYVTWDIHVMRVAYVTYKEYRESVIFKEYRESVIFNKSMEVDNDKCDRSR